MSTESFLKLFKDHECIKQIDFSLVLKEMEFFESLINEQLPDFEHTEYHDDVLNEINTIRSIIENSKLKELHLYFNEIIKRREGNYLKKSYEMYENEFINDSWKDVLGQYSNQFIPKETELSINGILGKYTSWQTPGLELSPGVGKFTNSLLALDPLYLVDKHSKILRKTKQQFNEAYQRRLRMYTLKNEADFSELPQEQFGLIFSWGFFEKIPLDIIKDYLKSFHNLLRPGGAIVMSYNNCEFKPSLKLTTTKTRAYNTETYMRSLIYGLGFDDIRSTDLDPNYSILEFKKPGEIKSQRASQTLGEIKSKI